MRKRLQIFISSTYTDLRAERQAAVETILEAGHIPAGMELFAAGSESQLEVVKRWINESDVYMLILGGRYGSIESNSGKSYTHLEYEYAVEKNIPLFAVVIKDDALDKKVQLFGRSVMEPENPKALKEFRDNVLSRMCIMFDDTKDIQVAVYKTLAELLRTHTFSGWVSGRDAQQPAHLLEQLSDLAKENKALRDENEALRQTAVRAPNAAEPIVSMGKTFSELLNVIQDITIRVPRGVTGVGSKRSLADIFLSYSDHFAAGVKNNPGANDFEKFLYGIATQLIPFGLIERGRVPNYATWNNLITTKAGNEFLTELRVRQRTIKAEALATKRRRSRSANANGSTGEGS